ncbi:MAG: helix-turn-helix domain-containing protein [Phycisphaerales bacterium]|nr:helix-turn-helix domain-containing protein [Phycisphaerales bacterium]
MSTPRPCSPAAASDGDVELRPAELAEYLGVDRADVARWRRRGIGPPWSGPPDDVRYRVSDLLAWVESQERANTGPGRCAPGRLQPRPTTPAGVRRFMPDLPAATLTAANPETSPRRNHR